MFSKTVRTMSLGAALICHSATMAQAEPAAPVSPDQQAEQSGQTPKAEIVKRGPDGKAEIVRIEGREYPVCKGEAVDGCINPRDAGLDWGDKEIDYWPGKPASQIDEQLPVSGD